MRVFNLLLLLVLSGCTSEYNTVRDKAFFEIEIVDELIPYRGKDAAGYARCSGGLCSIQILRPYYPECIEHEVRQGFEDDWHGDIPTSCR